MTQYLLAVYDNRDAAPPKPEAMVQVYADVDRFNKRLESAGAWVFGGGLHPADTATVVRLQNDEVFTTDGPFTETKEQIGGFWVIEAENLDRALTWAADASRACQNPVEVRPFKAGE